MSRFSSLLKIAAVIFISVGLVKLTDLYLNSNTLTIEKNASIEERLEIIFSTLDSRKNFSGVIGISIDGKKPIYKSFGSAVSRGIPSKSIQVDIGSITKMITSTMILKLVEQESINLDDKIGNLLENVPDDKAGITIHQLLTHTSGFVEAVGNDEEVLNKENFLQRAFKTKLKFSPGEKYLYSNVGYSILAAIIEEKSGKSYEGFLQSELVIGQNLGDIGYEAVFDTSRSLLTKNNRNIAKASWGGNKPYWNLIGNGGIVATPASMISFRRKFATGKLFNSQLVAYAQKPQVREGKSSSFYGYGMVVEDVEGIGRLYWHNGGNNVFSSNLTEYSEKGIIVFIAAASRNEYEADEAENLIRKVLFKTK